MYTIHDINSPQILLCLFFFHVRSAFLSAKLQPARLTQFFRFSRSQDCTAWSSRTNCLTYGFLLAELLLQSLFHLPSLQYYCKFSSPFSPPACIRRFWEGRKTDEKRNGKYSGGHGNGGWMLPRLHLSHRVCHHFLKQILLTCLENRSSLDFFLIYICV